MTAIEPDDQEEKPLDPAMESVRRKMVRLQIVSGAIMFVSLMAVFGAVVYKAMHSEAKEAASAVAALAWSASDSSTSGQTTKHWRPRAISSQIRS